MTISNLVCEVSERRTGLLSHHGEFITPELGNKIFDQHARIFAQRKDIVKPRLCKPPIPLEKGRWLNRRMDKRECRKQWLRALIDKEGTVNALASKIGTDPNYISSIVGPSAKRELGDDVAKRIEEVYSLPPGVMDLPSEAAQRLLIAVEGLDDAGIEEVLDFIRFKKSVKN